MASVSFLMAASLLRVPWLMASTTLLKSLVTVTEVVWLTLGASSLQDEKVAGASSSASPTRGRNIRFMI